MSRREPTPADHLHFLLSAIYDDMDLDPAHLIDLRRSGITDETIAVQKIRSVCPPAIFDDLLGFRVPAAVISMYLFPFFTLDGMLTDHVRVKIFPALTTAKGTTKYLQRRRSGVRLYFPLMTLDAVLRDDVPVFVIEGEKKAVAAAQLGLPAVGICGIEGWHMAGSHELLPEFEHLHLQGRIVELVPDGDVATNPAVRHCVEGFAAALARAGARPRLVTLATTVAA